MPVVGSCMAPLSSVPERLRLVAVGARPFGGQLERGAFYCRSPELRTCLLLRVTSREERKGGESAVRRARSFCLRVCGLPLRRRRLPLLRQTARSPGARSDCARRPCAMSMRKNSAVGASRGPGGLLVLAWADRQRAFRGADEKRGRSGRLRTNRERGPNGYANARSAYSPMARAAVSSSWFNTRCSSGEMPPPCWAAMSCASPRIVSRR